MQCAGRTFRNRFQAPEPRVVDDDNLAGLHVAHVGGAEQIEGTGLRGDDGGFAEFPDGERPEPPGVAGGDDLVLGQHDEAVGPLHLSECLHEGLIESIAKMVGHEVDDDLAVHGGLEDGALLFELGAEQLGVDEVSVVAQGVGLAGMVDEKRLGVGQGR